MKKYILPTVTIVCLLIGFLIGNAISNKANAQRFFIQNGHSSTEAGPFSTAARASR